MDSSSLEGCEDNKWLTLPTSSGDGNNEWGVFIGFLFYIWFLETIMIVGEFDVVDVCNGLCEKMIMDLEVFYEEDVWPKVG